MRTAPVTKIIEHSVVDGPGNRAAIFLQGCNFNCAYCHNPETIDLSVRPESLSVLTAEQVVERVAGAVPFIRGLTISGGECMLHAPFVYDVCSLAKQRFGAEFSCLLDSNGSLPFDLVLPVIDGVLLDVKAAGESTHEALTGAPLGPVLASVTALARAGKLVEVRTVVTGDGEEAFRCIELVCCRIREAAGADAVGRTGYKLIRYRPKGVRIEYLRSLKVPAAPAMERVVEHAKQCGFDPVTAV